MEKTRELISSLQYRQSSIEAMTQTIHDQLVLEMTKLEKLQKQEHQWIIQAGPSLISLNKIQT